MIQIKNKLQKNEIRSAILFWKIITYFGTYQATHTHIPSELEQGSRSYSVWKFWCEKWLWHSTGRKGSEMIGWRCSAVCQSEAYLIFLSYVFSSAMQSQDINIWMLSCVSALHGLSFLETSALDSSNVELAFHDILKGEFACCCTTVISCVSHFLIPKPCACTVWSYLVVFSTYFWPPRVPAKLLPLDGSTIRFISVVVAQRECAINK